MKRLDVSDRQQCFETRWVSAEVEQPVRWPSPVCQRGRGERGAPRSYLSSVSRCGLSTDDSFSLTLKNSTITSWTRVCRHVEALKVQCTCCRESRLTLITNHFVGSWKSRQLLVQPTGVFTAEQWGGGTCQTSFLLLSYRHTAVYWEPEVFIPAVICANFKCWGGDCSNVQHIHVDSCFAGCSSVMSHILRGQACAGSSYHSWYRFKVFEEAAHQKVDTEILWGFLWKDTFFLSIMINKIE